VINLSPKWKPGIQNGHTVRVQYSVPISFTLDNAKPGKPAENKTGAVDEFKDTQKVTPASIGVVDTKTDTGQNMDRIKVKDASLTPVYIVDGKEVNNLTTINPVDIESVSVLKDRSATALYGPRGANGVVVVTTKGSKLRLKSIEPKTDKQ
jgi:TonB-dependent SusC/RagA subfamily outer membrane receptor